MTLPREAVKFIETHLFVVSNLCWPSLCGRAKISWPSHGFLRLTPSSKKWMLPNAFDDVGDHPYSLLTSHIGGNFYFSLPSLPLKKKAWDEEIIAFPPTITVTVSSCHWNWACKQRSFSLQLHTDKAKESIQWKMTHWPFLCVKTDDNCNNSF